MGVKILKGIDPMADPHEVPREQWGDLVVARRFHCLGNIPTDCRVLLRLVADAEDCDWLGYGTRERYMRDGLNLDPVAAELAIEFLRAADLEVPVEYERAIEGGKKLRAKAGRPPKSEGENPNNVMISPPVQGNSRDYTVARLERDRPDLAEQVKAGAKSANAAAIEAGFRKRPTGLDALRAAWRKATDDERQQFLDEVTP